jgi:hypothetical protein
MTLPCESECYITFKIRNHGIDLESSCKSFAREVDSNCDYENLGETSVMRFQFRRENLKNIVSYVFNNFDVYGMIKNRECPPSTKHEKA